MVSERAKDTAEDWAAGAVVAAASVLPVVGGPLSIVIDKAFGSAVQRRNEKLLEEIAQDVAALHERGGLPEWQRLADSEEFLASLHRTLRMSQETSNAQKRKLLRNALLNGSRLNSLSESQEFLRLLEVYGEDDVRVLQAVEILMDSRTSMLEHASHQVQRFFETRSEVVPLDVQFRVARLLGDQLLTEASHSVVKEENNGRRQYGKPQTRQVTKTTTWHTISPRGTRFLDFVRDPLANG